MRIPVLLSHRVCRVGKRTRRSNQSYKRAGLYLAVSLSLGSLLFSACSGTFGGTPPTVTPMPALNQIHWCSEPLMIFRDEGAPAPTPTPQATTKTPTQATSTATPSSTPNSTPSVGLGTPQTISSWSTVKALLGFTVYLPATMPKGTCLVSAQATIHDPIFGGSFNIGFLFADHTSLSFSEAPLKSQSTAFQCNGTNTPTPTASTKSGTPSVATPGPTVVPSQLCSGAKNTTNIVILGPGTISQLQQVFNSLQPDVDWIPAS